MVVRFPDGQEARLQDAFTYNPAPVVTSVTPNNGKLAGGTRIVIQGSGFLPGARVMIGPDTDNGPHFRASSVEVMSSTNIMAITPPGKPGTMDVMVYSTDGQYISLSGGFTYNQIPTITGLSVDHGPSSGGTKVTIKGTGFLPGANVLIGGKAATATVRDSTTIEASTPRNPQGIWDIRVINPDTQEAIKREAFVSVGEVAYNYPNPFRASYGTTFRYVTNESVDSIRVKVFNLAGVPIGIVQELGSNEVRWYDDSIHAGLYVYLHHLEGYCQDRGN